MRRVQNRSSNRCICTSGILIVPAWLGYVDIQGVKLSEIFGRVDDDSHVFITFGSFLSTLLSCAIEIFDCDGKIFVRTSNTLGRFVDSHDSSENFDNFER